MQSGCPRRLYTELRKEEKQARSNAARERYTQLNAEFQRIARGDKKAFLSDQCKEIEENNRIGKTRYLFNKIRDTKEHFRQRWVHLRTEMYGHNKSRRY